MAVDATDDLITRLFHMHRLLQSEPEHAALYRFVADPPTTTMQVRMPSGAGAGGGSLSCAPGFGLSHNATAFRARVSVLPPPPLPRPLPCFLHTGV